MTIEKGINKKLSYQSDIGLNSKYKYSQRQPRNPRIIKNSKLYLVQLIHH